MLQRLPLRLRADGPIRRRSRKNQLVDAPGQVLFDSQEAAKNRGGPGTVVAKIEQSLKARADELLHQDRVRFQQALTHDNAPLKLDQILFDERDQLAES